MLTHNHFEFNDHYFRQVNGMAMGTMCAPTLATLSIGFLEWTRLFPALESHSINLKNYFVNNYFRFQDDGWIYLPDDLCSPEILLQIMNSMDISGKIKFEMTNNRNSSNFLCLNIVRNHGEFDVDIFY